MSQFELSEFLEPGDTVVVGQAAAEPPLLVEQLIAAAETVDDLTALCGYAQTSAWEGATTGRLRVRSYAGHGPLRKLSRLGLLDVLPLHYSRIEQVIKSGRLPVDVVLLQVGPADAAGYYDLGATVDYAVTAAETARAVIVEVNDQMPRTRSSRRLHVSKVTAAISASAPLADSPARPASEVERQVAAHVATLIPDGATIQLGVGALADAVANELRGRTNLRVRSGLVGEWLVDLHEAGALSDEPGSVVTGMALGGERLYAFLTDSPLVEMAPIVEQVDPAAIAKCAPYVSINSAIEVDLLGQVSSEVVGGRYVGAVGGQVDFFRASRGSENGMAIIAMASSSPSGESRIVNELGGPTTSLKSDVDVVVTEWGAAEISSASLSERADRIAKVAAPQFRELLHANRSKWI